VDGGARAQSIARVGTARRMLAQVLIAEADAFVAMWKHIIAGSYGAKNDKAVACLT
jgi:hypothetical protein